MRSYKAFLILAICIVSFPIFSQNGKSKLKSETGGQVEIIFKDGTTDRGELLKTKHKFLTLINPTSIESVLGLDAKQVKLKKADGEKVEYPAETIEKVIIYEDDAVKEFRYMPLKTINKKLQLVDTKRRALLPLVYDDVINLYAYNVYIDDASIGMKDQYGGTVVYLSRDDQDFAIIPMDQKGASLFNMKLIRKRMQAALTEIFNDCPETVAYINKEFNKKDKKKEVRAKYMKAYSEANEQISELPKDEQKSGMDDFYTNFIIQEYVDMIEDYKTNCPK